jgi:hypothetical protein
MIYILNTTVCLDPLLTARGVTKDSNVRVLVTPCTYQLAMLTQPDAKWMMERKYSDPGTGGASLMRLARI